MSASLISSHVLIRRVIRRFISLSSAHTVTCGSQPSVKLASIALIAPVKTIRALSPGPIDTSMALPKSTISPSR